MARPLTSEEYIHHLEQQNLAHRESVRELTRKVNQNYGHIQLWKQRYTQEQQENQQLHWLVEKTHDRFSHLAEAHEMALDYQRLSQRSVHPELFQPLLRKDAGQQALRHEMIAHMTEMKRRHKPALSDALLGVAGEEYEREMHVPLDQRLAQYRVKYPNTFVSQQ